MDSRPVISVVVRVRIGRLPSSVPAGLRRRNARGRQHSSHCEDSGDLASHFVLHSVAKLSGPLSGRTDQSNCLRFITSNVRMGTFDYSGNPERPIQAHRTIQAEGNKLRWITPFRRHKPTETHADSARGAALRFRQGAAAISGRTAHPRLGPAHRGKLERPSWRNQIIVWRRIGSIGRDRFSRTLAGGGKVSPSLRGAGPVFARYRRWAGTFCSRFPALTMTTFVLIVTFAVAGVTDGVRTERIGRFDSYRGCVAAGHAMYPRQKCQCVPESR